MLACGLPRFTIRWRSSAGLHAEATGLSLMSKPDGIYRVDDSRLREQWEDILYHRTGVVAQAKSSISECGCFDIALLDKDSLLRWLKADGGDNKRAEDVVGILLGHGLLHEHGKDMP